MYSLIGDADSSIEWIINSSPTTTAARPIRALSSWFLPLPRTAGGGVSLPTGAFHCRQQWTAYSVNICQCCWWWPFLADAAQAITANQPYTSVIMLLLLLMLLLLSLIIDSGSRHSQSVRVARVSRGSGGVRFISSLQVQRFTPKTAREKEGTV